MSTIDRREGAEQLGLRRSVREEILSAAMELFAKGGSRGTPLAAIAEHVGVTTPAITYHFGTKRALLVEVVEENYRRAQDRIRFREEATGLERLTTNRVWASLLKDTSEVANLARLATVLTAEALDEDDPGHAYFRAHHREFRRLIADLVRQGQRDGTIRGDADPKTVGAEVMAFMQGAQLQWLLDPDDMPIEEVFQCYFDRLQRDLAVTTR